MNLSSTFLTILLSCCKDYMIIVICKEMISFQEDCYTSWYGLKKREKILDKVFDLKICLCILNNIER